MDYSILKQQIAEEIKRSPRAITNSRALKLMLKNKTATYNTVAEYSKVLGDVASASIARNIAEGIADDELAAFAQECLAPIYRQCQDTMLNACTNVQTLYNEQAGISLKPVAVQRDESRIAHIIDRFNEAETFDAVKFLTNANVARSITRGAVNDSMKANSKFQSDSGLKTRISRSDGAGCCEWCATMVGTYDSVDKLPSDFWRIHRGCTCVIDYRVGKTNNRLSFKSNNNGRLEKVTEELEEKENNNRIRIPQFPASSISEKAKIGEYSLKLSKQQYEKHLENTKTYDTYMASRISKNLSPQSKLLISQQEAQDIIEKYSGTGIIRSDRKGNPMNIEDVTCDRIIGEYMQKGEWVKTNKAALHHGKDGTHIVPIKGNNYD